MKKLTVRLTRSPTEDRIVGQLAEHGRRVYFEYDSAFLQTGLALSPFKLPALPGLSEHRDDAFGLLPGLFDDSLPDGWGRLLMDRHFRRQGLDPAAMSPLDRLLYLGTRTMGALTYHPPSEVDSGEQPVDLHTLGKNAEEVMDGDAAEVLPQLLRAGGSPGGARPKVLVGIHGSRILSGESDLPEGYEHWLVKLAARVDARDAGPIEYAYALMAKAAAIDMPPVRLLTAAPSRRYFGVRRFDRLAGNRRVHVHTFGNLLHINFRIPSADYGDLFQAARALTRSHDDLLRLFRRLVFNVAAHVRDDHVKNFAFLLDEERGFTVTPAYDLTFSPGPGGEHSMTVQGEGREPTREHCQALATRFGIRPREAEAVYDEVNQAVSLWREFADQAGCAKAARLRVARELRPI